VLARMAQLVSQGVMGFQVLPLYDQYVNRTVPALQRHAPAAVLVALLAR
jgi:hypothetical protein